MSGASFSLVLKVAEESAPWELGACERHMNALERCPALCDCAHVCGMHDEGEYESMCLTEGCDCDRFVDGSKYV